MAKGFILILLVSSSSYLWASAPLCKKVLRENATWLAWISGDVASYSQFAREALDVGRTQEAKDWAQEILNLEPSHFQGNRLMAEALLAEGAKESAIVYLERASRDPVDGHRVLQKLYNIYKELGQTQNRLLVVNRILEFQPNNLNALGLRVFLLLKLNRVEQARQAFNQLSQAHPKESLTLIREIQLLKAESQFGHALTKVELLLRQFPEKISQETWSMEMLNLLRRLKRYDQQLAKNEDLISQFSESPAFQFRKVISLVDKGLYPEALAHLKSLEGEIPIVASQKMEAQIHFHMGRMDLARQVLLQLVNRLSEPDYFVVAGIRKIEKLGYDGLNFRPSDQLKMLMDQLDPVQLQKVLQIEDSQFWSFEPPANAKDLGVPIRNSFWDNTAYFRAPVDGVAVGEVRGPELRQ